MRTCNNVCLPLVFEFYTFGEARYPLTHSVRVTACLSLWGRSIARIFSTRTPIRGRCRTWLPCGTRSLGDVVRSQCWAQDQRTRKRLGTAGKVKQVDRRTDGRTDGRTDRWTDRWTHWRTDREESEVGREWKKIKQTKHETKQTNKQMQVIKEKTDRQTDRLTDWLTDWLREGG